MEKAVEKGTPIEVHVGKQTHQGWVETYGDNVITVRLAEHSCPMVLVRRGFGCWSDMRTGDLVQIRVDGSASQS